MPTRYTATYLRNGAFYVVETLVALNDNEALRQAQPDARGWQPNGVTLARLDRHITVFEASEESSHD